MDIRNISWHGFWILAMKSKFFLFRGIARSHPLSGQALWFSKKDSTQLLRPICSVESGHSGQWLWQWAIPGSPPCIQWFGDQWHRRLGGFRPMARWNAVTAFASHASRASAHIIARWGWLGWSIASLWGGCRNENDKHEARRRIIYVVEEREPFS